MLRTCFAGRLDALTPSAPSIHPSSFAGRRLFPVKLQFIFEMRNLGIILLMGLATFGVWVLVQANITSPLWGPGSSYRVYFGLFTYPDLIETLIFAAWAFLLARLSGSLFSGHSKRRWSLAVMVLLLLFFLYVRGTFLNLRPQFVLRQLVLVVLVLMGFLAGIRRRLHDQGASPPLSTERP